METPAKKIIEKYQTSDSVKITETTPAEIYNDCIVLSASFPEWTALTLIAEQALSKKWEELRKNCDTDGKTEKLIKATQEYADVQLCKAYEKSCLELLRALKKTLAAKQDEFKNYV